MNITFLCGSGGPNYPWEGSHLQKGIGGSEESLIRLAEVLAVRGHEVIVCNNCEVPLYYRGVYYFPCSDMVCLQNTDVAISWRNWTLLKDIQAKLKLHWTHDIPVGRHCPSVEEWDAEASSLINKVICLNSYHASIYTSIPEDKKAVIPIGLTSHLYQGDDMRRNPCRAIYFSHPNRGLDQLRAIWPQVHQKVPTAVLMAYWWEPEHFREPNREIGIQPMRALGEVEIANEIKLSGIFAYPSCFDPEIAPATCTKAQAGGAVPVVIPKGGMRDVLQYGIQCENLEGFTRELINMMLDFKRQSEMRYQMQAWAQATFDWTSIALQWEELFNMALQSKQPNAISGRGN